jgi:hypothetical protein
MLFAFFLLNAMVSGDILTDRETLGLAILVLVVAVPRGVVAGRAPGEPEAVVREASRHGRRHATIPVATPADLAPPRPAG